MIVRAAFKSEATGAGGSEKIGILRLRMLRMTMRVELVWAILEMFAEFGEAPYD